MFDISRIINNIYSCLSGRKSFLKNIEAKKSELQVKLDQSIISSSDPEELKNKIVKEIAIALNAYRCFFIEYDSTKNNFKKITNSYNSQRDSLSLLGIDIENAAPRMAMKNKYMKSLLIKDTEQFIERHQLEGLDEEAYFKKYNVKSSLSLRLEFGESFLGVLVVQYDDHHNKSKLEGDLKFLKNITEHISIALHLSILYSEEKNEKQRERLLRSIISIMSSDYNLTQITQKIFDILAKIYNAKTIFINVGIEGYENFSFYSSTEIDNQSNEKNNLNDTSIYELVDFDLIKNKTHYITDTHNFIIQNNLENSSVEKYFNTNNIKSLILLPILYENLSFGFLIIHFDKSNQITPDDLTFIRTVTNQLAIAIKQSLQYEKQRKTAERERILRDITEKIRSSLDVEDTLDYICKETAKLFNVQRTTIVSIPNIQDVSYFVVRKEYKLTPELKGLSQVKDFSKAAEYWWNSLINNSNTIAIDNINESDTPEDFKNPYIQIGVKSVMATAINKNKEIWGSLVLSEYNKYRHWTDEEITLLASIADQVYIAINQAELHNSLKQTTANQDAILNNMPFIAWLKNTDLIYEAANEPFAKLCRSSVEDILGKNDYEIFPEDMAEAYQREDKLVMEKRITLPIEEIIKMNDVNAYYEVFKSPVVDDKGNVIGTAGLARDISERKQAESELLSRQEKIIKANERESLLRKILEAMRGSLDINIIKNTIVREVGKALNADRCFLLTYDSIDDYFYIDKYSEYLSSTEDKSFIGFDARSLKVKWFVEKFKRKEDIDYIDSEEFIVNNNLQGSLAEGFLREYNIKSSYNISIYYAGRLLGYIIIHYTKQHRETDESDLAFLRIISSQAGIAIHQAELYQLTQAQAETEKFNRKILEILRNAIDKNTIKHLFVKNIGEYFNAGRVFFSDYDPKSKMYLPVEKGSEYLSSNEEKSFVGYDLSDVSIREYIQPLLEKREFKISCWEEYIKEKPVSQGLISRFEEANVKSSYNLPVIYEMRLMGYFCIEFTQKGCNKLSDENIKRIRNLCSQAGIALYHAELYTQAQEMSRLKTEFIVKIANESKVILNNMENFSEVMSKTEPNCHMHAEHLKHINESVTMLLKFTNNLIEKSKGDSI